MKLSQYLTNGAAAMGIVLLGGVSSTLAAGGTVITSGGNSTTGANSLNSNTTDVYNDPSVAINNLAYANNALCFSLDNGNNNLGQNTTVGGFSTGDLSLGGTFTTHLNNTPVVLSNAGSGLVSSNFGNAITGYNSENTNALNVVNNGTTSVNNDAAIHNMIGLNVSTGNNNIAENTVVGPVSLGGASLNLSVNNSANDGLGSMVLPSMGLTVSAGGSNNTTGANSMNSNTTTVTNDSALTMNNTSSINNTISASANTGNNNISGNTTVGPVHTGGVSVNLNLTNSAN